MGKHFGNLQNLKGVTYYSLSPNELKPFKGTIDPGFKNWVRRYSQILLYAGPPFFAAFLIHQHFSELYRQSLRKNPDDYKDDV